MYLFVEINVCSLFRGLEYTYVPLFMFILLPLELLEKEVCDGLGPELSQCSNYKSPQVYFVERRIQFYERKTIRRSEPIKLPRVSGGNLHLICYVAHSLTIKVASSTVLTPFLLLLFLASL